MTGLFLFMGGHALLCQVVLMRELLVTLYGHEICLGMLFSAWFLGIFGGASLGGRWARRIRSPADSFMHLLVVSFLSGPALLLLARLVRIWIIALPGVPIALLPTLAVALAVMAPQGALVGALFPLGCQALLHGGEREEISIGRIYVLEALGSLTAGLVLTFLLLPRFNGLSILLGMGTLGTAAVAAGRKLLLRKSPLVLALLAMTGALSLPLGGWDHLQELSNLWRWRTAHPGMELVAWGDSPYQHVELGRIEDQYSLFGDGHLLATFPDPFGDAFPAHLLMAQRPRPSRILILGGGPSSLLATLLRYPISRLVLVTLDPLPFHLSRPYLPSEIREALKDPRLDLVFTDGRYWVASTQEGPFDAVILQVPDPATALWNRYHTVEFYGALRRVLSPEGILLSTATGSVNYVGEEVGIYLGGIYRSLRKVFASVEVIPGERSFILAAVRPGRLQLDPQALSRLYRTGGIPDTAFRPEAFFYWIQMDRIRLWKKALASSRGPVNHDSRPTAYLRYLQLLDLFTSARFQKSPLETLLRLPFEALLVGVGLMWASLLLLARSRPDRWIPVTTIAVIGFAAMGLEIICLYLYQALRGYLYSRLGIIVALFMAGLSVGGWWGTRWTINHPRHLSQPLFLLEISMGALCLGLPFMWAPLFAESQAELASGWLVEAGVALWMGLAGFGTGAAFPLACKLMQRGGYDLPEVAGSMDAADHLGAAAGSLLTGTLLVPVFGLSKASLWMALLLMVCCSLFLFGRLDLHRRTR